MIAIDIPQSLLQEYATCLVRAYLVGGILIFRRNLEKFEYSPLSGNYKCSSAHEHSKLRFEQLKNASSKKGNVTRLKVEEFKNPAKDYRLYGDNICQRFPTTCYFYQECLQTNAS